MEPFVLKEGEKAPFALTSFWEKRSDVKVSGTMEYCKSTLTLFFDVTAEELRRECTHVNDTSWCDSCVECFIRPAGAEEYLNFEFSAAGYPLVCKGEGRANRVRFDAELVKSIPVEVKVKTQRENFVQWSLEASIDLKRFGLVDGPLKGSLFEMNLYGCGDKLKHPYFLVWNRIETESPDFHRPEYLRAVRFE